MSRLSFREQGYYEDASGGDEQSPIKRAHDDSDQSDTDAPRSSYELFGLNPIISTAIEGSPRANGTPRANNKSASGEMSNDVASSTGDDGAGDDSEVKSSKKKKRKKKRKLEEVSGSTAETAAAAMASKPAQSSTSTRPSTPSLSKALARFISTKRNLQEIPEPPEIEPPNDTFLQMFQDTFIPPQSVPDASSDDDSNAESDADSSPRKEKLKRNASTTSFATSTEGEDERAPITAPIAGSTDTFALQLFNLPYKITVEQMQAFGAKNGFHFENVVMGVDRKTSLPSGSATVYVRASAPLAAPGEAIEESNLYGDPHNDEVTECIQALQGEELGGRPVRVQRFIAKRRQSGSLGGRESGRYFFEDISCKCHNCGQVGHRQADCTNETAPLPCHLCAGLDHDAGSCPNITCYRCGKFGHHSRDCRFASMARPVVCTNCGSVRHDARACRESWQQSTATVESRVAGPMVRCMSCNKFGHVMCQPLPEIPAGTAEHVYCPNCGENGHHIDYPQLCYAVSPVQKVGESGRKRQKRAAEPMQCMEPKHEAFVKFPQLLSQIDSIPLSERLEFYQQFARRCSHTEQLLFPPLARQLASISASAASSTYNNNNSSAGRGRHSFGGGVLDNGRSVRYQDGVQRMSQHSRYEDSDDDFEELMDFASGQPGRERSHHQQHSGHKRARHNDRDDHYRAPPPPPPAASHSSRRHSFPLTNNSHRGGSYNSSGDQQYRDNQRNGGGNIHGERQWGNSGAAPRQPSVLDPAWQQRIESRKRRFQD